MTNGLLTATVHLLPSGTSPCADQAGAGALAVAVVEEGMGSAESGGECRPFLCHIL